MKNLAIIPARGGSKRIPRKNIKDFCGKPIIVYSIEAALNSNLFEETIVSTDDAEIANVAKKNGINIPFFRSQENSNDYAGLTDVCIEVVKCYEDLGMKFDTICCILPTAPFVNSKTIITAKKIFDQSDCDCVFPVVEYGYPVQRSLKIVDGFAKMYWPENYSKRSQDFEKTYHDAGQFYFIKTKSLLAEKKIFLKKSVIFVLNNLEVQDIDTDVDWQLAELKYKIMFQERGYNEDV